MMIMLSTPLNALLFLLAAPSLVDSFHTTNPMITRTFSSKGLKGDQDSRLFSNYGEEDTVMESIEALVNYHEGSWKGTSRSFTVVPDIAAGIVQRKSLSEYNVSVKLGLNIKDRDFSLTETFSWDEESDDDASKISSRSLSLNQCNVDVDSVDASYSLDTSLPDFPSAISGTDKLCQFVIEHCIAASDDRRMRCFILYGADQSLQRIVLCDETRIDSNKESDPQRADAGGMNNQFTARDLLEMQSDVDRLVDKLTGNYQEGPPSTGGATNDSDSKSRLDRLGESMSSSDNGSQKLSPHDISLLELSSGVWLGDAIIRDNPTVAASPVAPGQGFDGATRQTSNQLSSEKKFGDWSIGVQKVAFRVMWNFGEEIRQVVDVGKAMGSQLMSCMSQSLSGSVCVNEGLKRRMPKDERMVYIDWPSNSMVGILLGPASVLAPRYLNFNEAATKATKPFFTEFGLYQGTTDDKPMEQKFDLDSGDLDGTLPELCCSKISRVYNFEGNLKQGCTSFYTFNRFGIDDTE